MAANGPFMSLAPRPYSTPSRTVGLNGGEAHCSAGPGGTTSTWPANTTVGPCAPWQPRRKAQRLRTKKSSGPLSMRSQAKPCGASSAAITSRHPPSAGVTEARAISCCARRKAASDSDISGMIFLPIKQKTGDCNTNAAGKSARNALPGLVRLIRLVRFVRLAYYF